MSPQPLTWWLARIAQIKARRPEPKPATKVAIPAKEVRRGDRVLWQGQTVKVIDVHNDDFKVFLDIDYENDECESGWIDLIAFEAVTVKLPRAVA